MPQNLWSDSDFEALPDLEGLVYRSRLLAADRSIVNIYGGNTSSKLTVPDHLGRPTRVLYVKGSGTDLASITERGFAALKLDEVLPLRTREHMTDEEMTEYLSRCAFEPGRPRHSIEALLHAFVPHACVDHTHPDAVIAIGCSPNGRDITREVFGDRVVWVDYVRPGFPLSKWIVEAAESGPQVEGVLMAKHGLVTWGPDSKTCYLNTIRIVSEAADYVQRSVAEKKQFAGFDISPLTPGERKQLASQVLPVLRGALSERKRAIVIWDDEEDVLTFVNSRGARETSLVGAACPDHLVHTKRLPLFVDWEPSKGRESLEAAIREGVQEYVREYLRYFEQHKAPGDEPFDPAPRVVLIPGLGAFAAGKDVKSADVTRQLIHRAVAVMRGSSALGGFQSLSPAESYEIEYWPLELYKLKLAPPPKELAGRVALITGGGSGIGRAAAHRLCSEGACVVVTDIMRDRCEEVAEELVKKYGEARAVSIECDVTKEEDVEAAFNLAVMTYGGLDIVVCSAGIASSAPVEETTLAEWHRNQEILVTGYFLPAREAFRVMKKQGIGGSIVFVCSKNSVVAGKNAAAYSSAKAAELHLARCLAEEGGEYGIRVNSVLPDAVLRGSSIWQGRWREERAAAYGVKPEELEEYYRKRTTLKLSVYPEDLAEAILFLASDRAAKTTGGALTVDAGVPAAYLR